MTTTFFGKKEALLKKFPITKRNLYALKSEKLISQQPFIKQHTHIHNVEAHSREIGEKNQIYAKSNRFQVGCF